LENYSNYTDDQLLVLLKENEPTKSLAFKVIWEKYSSSIMQYCYFHLKNESEVQDLFQKIWIVFYENIIKEKKGISFKFYIFNIANNQLMNFLRLQKIRSSQNISNIELDTLADSNSLFIEKIESNEIVSNFQLALNFIEPPTNEYLMLHWVGGLSFKEISEMFEESYDSVRMKCTRGMNKVMKILEPIFKEKKLKDN
jgi:RNA polymerase sigma-70 factor (ECF subfamily)